MKIYIQAIVILATFQLAGCATQIISAEGDYYGVVIKIDDKSKEKYYLKSLDYPYVQSEAFSNNGVLNFPIKYRSKTNNCLFITNEQDEILSFVDSEFNGFRNYLWSDHSNLSYKIDSLNKTIEQNKSDIRLHESKYRNSNYWISNNSHIYVNGQCIRPPLGERPDLACNETERDGKSNAICLIQGVGCGVTSMLLGNIFGGMVVNFVSGSACDLIADELIEPQDSPIPTIAKNASLALLAKLGGPLGQTAALAWLGVEFVNCVDTVKDICTRKYEKWINKPVEVQNICIGNVQSVKNEPMLIERYNRYLRSNFQKIQNINEERSKIARKYDYFSANCSIVNRK